MCLALALRFCGPREAAPASLSPISDPVARPLSWTPARGEGEFLLQAGGVARVGPGRGGSSGLSGRVLRVRGSELASEDPGVQESVRRIKPGKHSLRMSPKVAAWRGWVDHSGQSWTGARAPGFCQLPQQEPLGRSHSRSVNKLQVSLATHSHHGCSDCYKLLPRLQPASAFSSAFRIAPGKPRSVPEDGPPFI